MRKLSEISAPAIAGVIRERTATAAIAEIKNCIYDGADMIDFHLSCLETNDVDTLRIYRNCSQQRCGGFAILPSGHCNEQHTSSRAGTIFRKTQSRYYKNCNRLKTAKTIIDNIKKII